MKKILNGLVIVISVIAISSFTSCKEKESDSERNTSEKQAVQKEAAVVFVDSIQFGDIADKPLSNYIDPMNIGLAEEFISTISEPEQYYIRTWIAQDYPVLYDQYAKDEAEFNKVLGQITFDQAKEKGKSLADKYGMSAEDLKRSFERQK